MRIKNKQAVLDSHLTKSQIDLRGNVLSLQKCINYYNKIPADMQNLSFMSLKTIVLTKTLYQRLVLYNF